jgi:two-component system sensor histidine kinase KdpD
VLRQDLLFARADPILLDQVLANLVGNAVRYAGAGAHMILEGRSEGRELVLSVADNGPGIAADMRARVCDKFVRAPTSGDAGEGTGLGLAIAKGIIEAHGGALVVESPVRDGRGTRVVMRLPLPEKSR